MTTTEKKFRNNDLQTKLRSKYLITGNAIALFIAFSPYFFYIYQSFPDGKVWETSLFTYESNYFESVSTLVWTIMGKLIPAILLVIWFFTCRHWWYPVLLIPIAMFLFQLISLINDDAQSFDEIEIYYLAPIILIILFFVYSIRIKIFDRIHGIDLSEINTNIKNDKKTWWNRFR